MRKAAPPQGCTKKWTEEEAQTLLRLYEGGRCYQELADYFGRSVNSISGALTRFQKTKERYSEETFSAHDNRHVRACILGGGFPRLDLPSRARR